MEGMTQAEYARHRGVTRQAVSKLVLAGKISVNEQGRIDPAVADYQLGETRLRVNSGDEFDDAPVSERGQAIPVAGSSESIGLTKARTATEVYRAKTAQLEFDERTGKLLPVFKVQRAMERCAEALVREIDQLAGWADDITSAVARGGVGAARQVLKEKSRILRETLARTMTIMADEPEDEAGE